VFPGSSFAKFLGVSILIVNQERAAMQYLVWILVLGMPIWLIGESIYRNMRQDRLARQSERNANARQAIFEEADLLVRKRHYGEAIELLKTAQGPFGPDFDIYKRIAEIENLGKKP
jgi:hypothetical protein